MKILIACEFSGIVREAFRKRGHDAWSCDLLPTEIPSLYHIQDDVLKHLNDGWDLMIAHPPCTYLSNAGARWLYAKGKLNQDRYEKGLKAKDFFLILLNSNINRIAIENPTPSKIYELPPHSQVIQPYQYGHNWSKRTLLWLKNLPCLQPTNITSEYKPYLPSNTGGAKRGHKATPRNISQKDSSKTFQGIADAMVEQWVRV
jgi:hypothetical protein